MLAGNHEHAQEGHALPVNTEPSSEVLTGATQLITKAAVTPEQADLLQVMQDVTGRFITNSILQLKRRAATLCLQELQEYKRSKVLNVLGMPTKHCQEPSQVISASYLVPSDTHEQASKMVVTTTEALPTPLQHTAQVSDPRPQQPVTSSTPAFSQTLHTESVSEPNKDTRHNTVATGTEAATSAAEITRNPALAAKATTMHVTDDKAAAAGSDAACKQSAPMLSAPLQATHVATSATKQQWMPAPNPTPLPAWPQGPAQHAAGPAQPWAASPAGFGMAQPSMGFNPALSFGKQPCAVMW